MVANGIRTYSACVPSIVLPSRQLRRGTVSGKGCYSRWEEWGSTDPPCLH